MNESNLMQVAIDRTIERASEEYSKVTIAQAFQMMGIKVCNHRLLNSRYRQRAENREARMLLLYPDLADYYAEQKSEWARKAVGTCTTLLTLVDEVLTEFKIKFDKEKDQLSSRDLLKTLKELSSAMLTIMDTVVKVENRNRELESTLSVNNTPNSVATLSDEELNTLIGMVKTMQLNDGNVKH
jgi:hypothetical protein